MLHPHAQPAACRSSCDGSLSLSAVRNILHGVDTDGFSRSSGSAGTNCHTWISRRWTLCWLLPIVERNRGCVTMHFSCFYITPALASPRPHHFRLAISTCVAARLATFS